MKHIDTPKRVSMISWLGFALAVLPSIGAEAPIASSPPATIAVVNGEAVPVERVERTLSRSHQGRAATQEASLDIDRLLFKVINDVLIAQEARAMGMDEEPPVVEEVSEYRQQLATRRLEYEEIDSRSQPSEAEVRAYFENRYRRVTFRVLTVDDKETAASLLDELRGGADMAALAEKESIDPYRMRGGLVEDLEHVDLQLNVADLLFSLEPGQLGGPLQTDLGYSVVRPESFGPAAEERFAQVEREVRSIVRMDRAQAAKRDVATRLRGTFRVEIDEAIANSVQPERLPDGRLAPTIDDPEAVVVTIDGQGVITAADFGKAVLKRWDGIRNLDAARGAASIVLTRLVEDALMHLEAQRRGYDRLPEIERAVEAFEADLLVSKYLEEVVEPRIEVEPEEMRAYYEAHQQEMNRPPRVRLGQITVATKEEAERIVDDLEGGADLAWLADRHSIDGFKESSGDRGWYVPRPGMAGFNSDLFQAEVGDVLEPIGEPGNWVVLKVLAREEQGIYPYDEVAGNVRNKVYEQKSLEALQTLITTLRDRSEIQIDIETLDQLQITGMQVDGSAQGDGFGHRQ